MINKKMIGNIKWFKERKGYGYIIGADDETYFFERINCVNNEDNFNEGEEVWFVPNFIDFEYASEVEKVNKGGNDNE